MGRNTLIQLIHFRMKKIPLGDSKNSLLPLGGGEDFELHDQHQMWNSKLGIK